MFGVCERLLREQRLGPLGGAGVELAVAVQAVETVRHAIAVDKADDVRAELGELALAAAQVDEEMSSLLLLVSLDVGDLSRCTLLYATASGSLANCTSSTCCAGYTCPFVRVHVHKPLRVLVHLRAYVAFDVK